MNQRSQPAVLIINEKDQEALADAEFLTEYLKRMYDALRPELKGKRLVAAFNAMRPADAIALIMLDRYGLVPIPDLPKR